MPCHIFRHPAFLALGFLVGGSAARVELGARPKTTARGGPGGLDGALVVIGKDSETVLVVLVVETRHVSRRSPVDSEVVVVVVARAAVGLEAWAGNLMA